MAQLKHCLLAYYKTRNAGTRNSGTRNTGRTVENPGTVAEQRNTSEHQRDTPEQQVTPAEHPGTTEPYKTKNNCSDFKEDFNTFKTFNSRWKYLLLLTLKVH